MDFRRLWEVLKKHDAEFVSINETFDTSTPMGRAMLNIMVFAQPKASLDSVSRAFNAEGIPTPGRST